MCIGSLDFDCDLFVVDADLDLMHDLGIDIIVLGDKDCFLCGCNGCMIAKKLYLWVLSLTLKMTVPKVFFNEYHLVAGKIRKNFNCKYKTKPLQINKQFR
eukprot:292475_1